MLLQGLDVAVLIAYFVIIAVLGFSFSKKNTTTEEYFLGGRSFPGWLIGLSLIGTSISSITFLAYPGDAFKTAWMRYLPNFMLPIGVLIAAYLFLPFFRKDNATTAYQFLEKRFGPSIRTYAASAFVFGQVVRISIILYLLSLVIHEMTGFSSLACIIVAGGFVGAYTVMGGIRGVIWTDAIQTIVLMFGGLVCIAVIISELPGGLSQIIDVASADAKFAFAELRNGELIPISWNLDFTEKTIPLILLFGLTIWLTEYSSNQNTVQRFVAAKSSKDAKNALWVCVCASLPIWAFYMFLGTSLYVFFKVFPTPEATDMLLGAKPAEQIMPFFITHYLPSGITGLVIAAAIAAAMSSLDSSINAISTVSITDIYKRHIKKDADDRHYLTTAKIISLCTAVVMILGAWYFSEAETKTIQDTATTIASLLGGGLLGLYLLAFLTDKGDARSVWVGLVATLGFTFWTILAKKNLLPETMSAPFELYYAGFIGNLVMFIVGYMASTFFQSKRTLLLDNT